MEDVSEIYNLSFSAQEIEKILSDPFFKSINRGFYIEYYDATFDR